jgi:uncharacterized protein
MFQGFHNKLRDFIFLGKSKALTAFLELGADPNIRNTSGQTALFDAIHWTAGFHRILLKFGADVNAISAFGTTPLHYAARYRVGSIPGLLQCGADPFARNMVTFRKLNMCVCVCDWCT